MECDTLNSIALRFDTIPGELAHINKKPSLSSFLFPGMVCLCVSMSMVMYVCVSVSVCVSMSMVIYVCVPKHITSTECLLWR